jgi:hypothetical protein
VRTTELKRHLDGGDERFGCELVLRRAHVAVIRFQHRRRLSADGFTIPRGSHTDGFFWTPRPYGLYRIWGPDGSHIADRFDVLEDCRIGDREVSYLDLLVDVWVAPDGAVLVEDEEEVADHVRRGLLSRAQVRHIERATALLLRDHRRIIREAARLLAATGR